MSSKFLKNTWPFWGLVAIAVLLTLTSFSNAYANPSCGATITTDTPLNDDLTCTTTTGLIIGANSITLDLNGFTLSGATCGNCHGIRNVGFDDVTIKSGTINGFEQGVRGEGVSNYVLDSLTFTGQTSSHAIDILDSASATIRDSTITIPTTSFLGPEAIRLESVASVQVTNVNIVGGFVGVNFACGICDGTEPFTNGNIVDSTINGAFIGVLIANSDDATITNNQISNGVTTVCSAPFCVPDATSDSKGISIGFDSRVQITGTTITGNEILNNNGFGIRVSSTQTSSTGIQINSNSITGSTNTEVENQAPSGTLDASGNWFGINTPAGVAAEVTSNVDYTPWLDVGTDTDAETVGFQGDFSVLNVDDDSPQTGSTGRISEGISDVTSGGTVKVAAGSYETGAIILNKPLTLISDTGDYRTTGTTLTGHTEFRLVSNINGLTIKGFEFKDITGTTFQATIQSVPGVGESHDNILIEKNSFTNTEKHAVKTTASNNNFIINDNKLNDIGDSSVGNGLFTGFQIFHLTNGQVTNNIIDITTFAGINFDDITGSTISGNTISNTVSSGIQVANSPSSNSVISGNTITNANTGNQADKGGIAIYPNSNDITITGNTLTNNFNGFAVRDKVEAISSDVIVTNNKISSNTGDGAVNKAQGGGTLDARNNYWGHPSGPTHSSNNPNGKGNSVSDNVNFTPWYINPQKTKLSTKFSFSGTGLESTTNDVTLDSDSSSGSTTGQAALPPSIDTITLSDTTTLDLTSNLQQASGNDIIIGGVTKQLNSFVIGGNTLDLKANKPVVGDKTVDITKAVKLASGVTGNPIILKNSDFASASISIPDATSVLSSAGWSGTILPPKIGSSTGTAPSGFSVGGTVIEVGSPDVVLLFDTAVDVLLSGVTGDVGYKPAGSSTWIQITNACGGTFDNPDPPTFPGECFISDGTDTKIVTFHFTEFGELNTITTTKSGGGYGDKAKPVLQSNSLSSPGSGIFGGSLSLDPNQPLKTPSLFETNDEIDLELSFFENTGPQAMQRVTLFTNIRDFDARDDSDLYIEWNKGQPIKVHDPNGFLKDNANVTTAINGSNLDMTFYVTFAKPMETSNIVLYFWDYSRHGVVVTFEDALKIIGGASDIVDITNLDNAAESEDNIETINKVSDSLDKIRQELNGAKPIPAWIKTSAGWWSEKKINDADFVSGIEFLIQNDIIEVPKTEPLSKPSRDIPDWLGNTASWWSDGLIPDEAFIQSIQWLIANGVMTI